MVKTIGIIGRTADGSTICDGQTIKTRVLRNELGLKYPQATIKLVDTYNYKKYPLKLLKNLLVCLKEGQVIFILLSRNGMRVLFPIVNFINRFYHKPIFHDCIGGSLAELIMKYGKLKKELNKFNVNWVESKHLKQRLEAAGVLNVEYLPNFKRLNILNDNDLIRHTDVPFRFCTFSRVNKAKGINEASEAIIRINNEVGNKLAYLDVYGPIEGNYGAILKDYIDQADGAITYKGVADYSKSTETLKDYYALLFPTTFYGEGFPGTVLDAFYAGLPIIATNWHLNGEIITHKKTGYLYDWNDTEGLERWIKFAVMNPDEMYIMKKNCIKEAELYTPDYVMEVINKKILASII